MHAARCEQRVCKDVRPSKISRRKLWKRGNLSEERESDSVKVGPDLICRDVLSETRFIRGGGEWIAESWIACIGA